MQTGILRFLLNLLKERSGALLGLARKGLDALRSILGSAGGLIRPLIKKVVSFVMSKLAPAAPSARSNQQSSLQSLKQRVQAVMQGTANEPEIEDDDLAAAPDLAPVHAVIENEGEATVASTIEAAPAIAAEICEHEPPIESHVSAPASDTPDGYTARSYAAPGGPGLSVLAPVLGRAVLRALNRRRIARPEPFAYTQRAA